MERQQKTSSLSSNSKLHIFYSSVILIMSVTFFITVTTMKSSYENILAKNGIFPEGDKTASNQKPANSTNMPPNKGGMPPMIKKQLEGYREALVKDPNDLKALKGLGNMYYDIGKYDKSIEYYEQIIKVDQKMNDVRVDLATAYFYTKDSLKAIELYKQALEQNPSHLNARFNLGVVYKSLGKTEKTKKEWTIMMDFVQSQEEKDKLKKLIDKLDTTKTEKT